MIVRPRSDEMRIAARDAEKKKGEATFAGARQALRAAIATVVVRKKECGHQ
jgi:hypothetical protein